MFNCFRRIIFFLTIYSLPFQLGKHFWLSYTIVRGFHLDLLSPVIYLTDLLIFLYLCVSFPKIKENIFRFKFAKYIPIIIFIGINIYVSLSPLNSFFSWLRWIFYFSFFIVLISEKELLKKIELPFLFSIITICLLGLVQLIIQQSLGSFFYFLGERPLSPLLPQIAKLALPSGQLLLRPYATFSHPNSFAGFLLISLLILKQVTFKYKKILNLFITFTIFTTLSKSALLALVIILLPFPFLPTLFLILIISLLPIFSSIVSWPLWLGNSALIRLNYGHSAVTLLNNHLLFGIGLNNYLIGLSRYLSVTQISYTTLQPIHSLPILFLTETGLLGLLLLLALIPKLKLTLRKLSKSKLSLLKKMVLIVALTGSVDHYWWTLPQNKLILVLILAIIFNRIYDKSQIRHNYH